MKPEHYRPAPTIQRNAFPSRGTKRKTVHKQTKTLKLGEKDDLDPVKSAKSRSPDFEETLLAQQA